MNNKNSEIITVREAAKILDLSTQKIYRAIKQKKFDVYGNATIRLSRKQVEEYKQGIITAKSRCSPYGDIGLDFDESLKMLESFHNPNSMRLPLKYLSKSRYAISNKARVINLSYNKELSQNPASHGYLQVDLVINKKKISLRVHVLTAYVWCPNSKFKNEVHHIDGNLLNNNANNLIWMSSKEHDKAHRLLDEAKKTDDWSIYTQYILSIQEDNKWTDEYRCITFEKDNAIIFVWITKSAYIDYKTGLRTLDEIYWNEVKAESIISKIE